MELKSNLHFHSAEDPHDSIDYTLKDGIDRAAELDFDVLAVTLHNKVIKSSGYYKYAQSRGILLISGIEVTIDKNHVVILNADKKAEDINTFDELKEYGENKEDTFILAPHPYHLIKSLGSDLRTNIEVFDGIEKCWFFHKFFNIPNKMAKSVAREHNLPFISTSDAHFINQLENNYTIVEAKEKSSSSVIRALKDKRFKNKSEPAKLFTELMPFTWMLIKEALSDDQPKNKKAAPNRSR